MVSQVFYADLRVTPRKNLFSKLDSLLERVDLRSKIKKNHLVAIKLHFGEKGNTAYIRPIFVRKIVDKVKESQGRPFLTDTSTLYIGNRAEAVSHLTTAIENGFAYAVAGAPLIIADGIRGNTGREVNIKKPIYREVSIATEIVNADNLVGIAHFKGHDLAGFGGTLKNLGMGCASRKGKLAQHSTIAPKIDESLCIGCQECMPWCAFGAISLVNDKARIDPERCQGCGQCILVCPQGAVQIQWNQNSAIFQKKMVEYAYGALRGKEGSSVFLNFIMQVSSVCDCCSYSDIPIVEDVGIVVSTDPVAIDQASVDLVNLQSGNPNSALKSGYGKGEDKFRGIFPQIDWEVQLKYGEEIGLGFRRYELIKV
jgi:hypothetical protein